MTQCRLLCSTPTPTSSKRPTGRNFLYAQEKARGLDYTEDLAVPGFFRWELSRGEAWLIMSAQGHEPDESFARIRAAELRRRQRFAAPLAAADAYIVRRGAWR